MNLYILANVDDLAKVLVLDEIVDFNSRKINQYLNIPEDVNKIIISERKKILNNDENLETKIKLMQKLIVDKKLTYYFNIPKLQWIFYSIRSYIMLLDSQFGVQVEKCTRYSKENFEGVKVVATRNIERGVRIKSLTGIYKPINLDIEKDFELRKCNFSILYSTLHKTPMLFLGTAALVNHDCDPNCTYESLTRHSVIIRTLKDIKKSEEIFCYYSDNYFGNNNENCECLTCERICGAFSKSSGGFDQSFNDDNARKLMRFQLKTPPKVNLEREMSSVKGANGNILKTLPKNTNNSLFNDEEFIQKNHERGSSNQGFDQRFNGDNLKSPQKVNLERMSPIKDSDEVNGNPLINHKLKTAKVVLERISSVKETLQKKLKIPVSSTKKTCTGKPTASGKLYFCPYCKSMQQKLARHLICMHLNEEEVRIFNNMPKNSEKRRKAIEILRLRGFRLHNTETKYNTGVLLLARRSNPRFQKSIETDYKSCPKCENFFSTKNLEAHVKNCAQNK